MRHAALFGAILFGAVEAVVGDFPVYDVPPGGDVVGAAVLVLEVVGVLPDVEADDGEGAFHDRAVLVGGRDDLDVLPALDQPRPTGAEARRGGGGEGFLEFVERGELSVDRLGEIADRRGALLA